MLWSYDDFVRIIFGVPVLISLIYVIFKREDIAETKADADYCEWLNKIYNYRRKTDSDRLSIAYLNAKTLSENKMVTEKQFTDEIARLENLTLNMFDKHFEIFTQQIDQLKVNQQKLSQDIACHVPTFISTKYNKLLIFVQGLANTLDRHIFHSREISSMAKELLQEIGEK